MGCAGSKEGVVHGQSEEGASKSAEIPPGASTMTISIPSIPGWDGVPVTTISTQVEYLMKGSWGKISTSMDPLTSLIHEKGAAGYKFAAVFLPVNHMDGKRKGQPLDGEPAGFMSFKARAMCIFLKDHREPELPLDTLMLQAPMTVTRAFSASNQVSGYEGLYGQLGQAGQQGFPLSCILDEPNLRCNGLFSAETYVHLICQRHQGVPAPPSQYLIANCPIQMNHAAFSTSKNASMPNLVNILSSYTSQGYKISSVYNPPTVSFTGLFSTESQCHIALEKTALNYYVTVCDVALTVKMGFGGGSYVDHNQYTAYIQAYAGQGWQLAGLIDLPDNAIEGFTTISSTIKLIFQAPALGGGPGGYVALYSVYVTVPEGSEPGSNVEVKHPGTGVVANATVPPGVPPGGIFRVQFD